jgi:hypothetical protein
LHAHPFLQCYHHRHTRLQPAACYDGDDHSAHRSSWLLPRVQVGSTWFGTFDFGGPEFDWGASYSQPDFGLQDLVIYEMAIRCGRQLARHGVARRGGLGAARRIKVEGAATRKQPAAGTQPPPANLQVLHGG